MALETATYISGLVAVNPLSTDPKSQGDDHLRLIKSVLLNSFPGVSGAVTATHTELNYVAGVTSGIQAQINAITAQLSGGSAIALNSVAAATNTATIGNGANQINWNWTLTGASGKGFNVSETAAATNGAGSQDLVRISTLASSTANPLRVTARGSDAISVSYLGAVTIQSVGATATNDGTALTLAASATPSTGVGGSVSITAGGNGSGNGNTGSVNITCPNITNGGFGTGGSVNLTAGNGPSGQGGDIKLQPGTGSTAGRVNFVNSNVANGTVASTFTASVGPTGASTSIVGWLAIKVGGTARYIPYW